MTHFPTILTSAFSPLSIPRVASHHHNAQRTRPSEDPPAFQLLLSVPCREDQGAPRGGRRTRTQTAFPERALEDDRADVERGAAGREELLYLQGGAGKGGAQEGIP